MRERKARQRFRAGQTVAPRYDDKVLGLPASAMVITNSERRSAWCPRRWWYEYGNGLTGGSSPAMRFGSAFHEVMELVLGWHQRNDGHLFPVDGLDRCANCGGGASGCELCDFTGLGAVSLVAERMRLTPEAYDPEDGGVEAEVDRLTRAVRGWLHVYGLSMTEDWQVVGTELAVAAPITSPHSGEVYRSKVPVVTTLDGWRLASATDDAKLVQQVVLPWYQVARLDAVVVNRRSGNIWLWETKTSASPTTYGQGLGLDTQLPGYLRALWWLTAGGHFGSDRNVEGYIWDVSSSSHQKDPKRLANGKLSVDKRQRIPSWAFEAELQAEDASRYTAADLQGLREMLQHLRETVDVNLYHREFGAYTPQQLRRYEVELYAEAVRLAAWRRAVVGTAVGGVVADDEKVASEWHRVPLCRQPGGSCPFTGVCLEDSTEGRASFTKREPVQWLPNASTRVVQVVNNNEVKETIECPF